VSIGTAATTILGVLSQFVTVRQAAKKAAAKAAR